MGLAITIPRPPQRLTLDPLLSDAEFEELCFANSDLQVERTKDGVIVVHAPTGLGSGSGNSIIAYQLTGWWLGHRRGRVTDSNTGFFLPDGSMLSPDAAYITAEQEATLNNEDLKHFGRMTPALSSNCAPSPILFQNWNARWRPGSPMGHRWDGSSIRMHRRLRFTRVAARLGWKRAPPSQGMDPWKVFYSIWERFGAVS